jgi:hypothetical protein
MRSGVCFGFRPQVGKTAGGSLQAPMCIREPMAWRSGCPEASIWHQPLSELPVRQEQCSIASARIQRRPPSPFRSQAARLTSRSRPIHIRRAPQRRRLPPAPPARNTRRGLLRATDSTAITYCGYFVALNPSLPGGASGELQMFDSSSNLISGSLSFLTGVGQGPAASILAPAAEVQVASGLSSPHAGCG